MFRRDLLTSFACLSTFALLSGCGSGTGLKPVSAASAPLYIATTATSIPVISGVSSQVALDATGGTPTYEWSVASGNLPAGLTLSPSTGIISGTPSTTGTSSVTISASDHSNPVQTATVGIAITVVPRLVLSTAGAPAGQVGVSYAFTPQVSGGTTQLQWAISSGTLPAGLTLNAASGAISGTPTQAGAFSFALTVADGGSPVQTQTVTYTLNIALPVPALVLTTPMIPSGQVGTAYAAGLQASGGTPAYKWSISSGNLPTGLTLNSATGAITGTPTASGSFTAGVTVSDSGSPVQSQTATVTFRIAAPALTLSVPTIPAGQVGLAYVASLQASGGIPAYKWSLTSGNLPTGLTLDSATGAITGTPTASGTFTAGVMVSDSGSPVQSQTTTFTFHVAAPALTLSVPTIPAGQVGVAYAASLQASGGTPAYKWSISSGTLPAGLALNYATGAITGTPTASGSFTAGVTVLDSGSPVQSQTATLAFNIAAAVPALALSTPVFPAGQVGTAYFASLQASGGTPAYKWSVSGALPSGLTLNISSGVISGTPTASGTFHMSFSVSDSGSPAQSQTVAGTLTIAAAVPALQLGTPVIPAGQVGTSYSASLVVSGGTPAYKWSVTSGSLPAGITLNPATGVITGTPTASGAFSVAASVSDSGSPAQSQSETLSIVINPATPTLVLSGQLAPATVQGTDYSAALSASGGKPNYTWSLSSGALPAGLTLSSSGVISGRSTAPGSYTFTAMVSDQGSPAQTANATYTILVLPVLSASLPAILSGQAGTAYASSLHASGGVAGYTWSLAAGSLPAGISLNASTGLLSGTPSAAGVTTAVLSVSDSGAIVQHASISVTITIAAAAPAQSLGTTWYVRPDGGSRYSKNMPNGQCDGMSDVAYPGSGVNQHCAFNDARYLWQDGSYTTSYSQSSFPAYGWVGSGGDTYIIRGSIADGVSYRVGFQNNSTALDSASGNYWGVAGDPYDSGAPVPLSGTATQHTRILGGNYGACHTASAKTQLHGGYGVYSVLDMRGASYVDIDCLDITDFSSCGRASQTNTCNTNLGSISDFAQTGIRWNRSSTNDTVTDVHIHGLASTGMAGPTGDGVTMDYIDLIGNAASGWNADAGDGTTGTGKLLVQHYNISWNGCTEEYPVKDALPYQDCTDDNVGGYGDGFGTATTPSSPAWNATFDQGIVSYNTQDGLDALHLNGSGSSMTVTRTQAYGNMGQQIKVGGAAGSAINNLIVTNCNALRQAIPGTPAGFNSRLSDFCRAADTGVLMSMGANTKLTFDFNTIYSASVTGVEIDCDTTYGACDNTSTIDFRNNIFLGFPNSKETGYPSGGSGNNSNPIFNGTGVDFFGNAGSVYTNNITYHASKYWNCAAPHEKNAICSDPGLADETWHVYGAGSMAPSATSVAIGSGQMITTETVDFNGVTRTLPPTVGALQQ